MQVEIHYYKKQFSKIQKSFLNKGHIVQLTMSFSLIKILKKHLNLNENSIIKYNKSHTKRTITEKELCVYLSCKIIR